MHTQMHVSIDTYIKTLSSELGHCHPRTHRQSGQDKIRSPDLSWRYVSVFAVPWTGSLERSPDSNLSRSIFAQLSNLALRLEEKDSHMST